MKQPAPINRSPRQPTCAGPRWRFPGAIRRARLGGALLLGLCFSGQVFALDPTRDLTQYNCQSWTRRNGLPVDGIKAITQSPDGYLWLGTTAGLLRFDGLEFKLFEPTQVRGVRSRIVTCVAPANDGGIWVGLQTGSFGHFDGRSLSFRGRAAWGGLDLDIRSLEQTKDGTLWLAAQRTVARISPAGVYEPILTTTDDRPVNILFHLADSRGRHWIATANQGLFYWQDGKLASFPDPGVTSTIGMAEDAEGNLWMGNADGLACYDANLRRKPLPPLVASVRALLVDRQGTLWIGTDGHGLIRYLHGTYAYLDKTSGLASDFVNVLREDDEGNLWVGTTDGLNQLRDVKFAARNASAGPDHNYAAAVTPSARGGAWVASDAGITYFGDGNKRTYGAAAGMPAGAVKRVFEARNGDVYFVSGLSTLGILAGGKVVAVHAAPTLAVGMVEDATSVIVSVGGSLVRANRQGLTPYAFSGATPACNWILNLAPGKDGVIWVASENGIFRVQDGTFRHWSVADGLPELVIQTIMEDRDGTVWATTQTDIVRLKDDKIRVIGRKDGLFDDNIYAIVPDDLGNFWIDSGRGIFRVSRQEMNDFADGRTGRVTSIAFDGSDSVITADKSISQERVGCRSLDGRIWFPSAKGIVIIDPAHIPGNRIAPDVHIDRILANNLELDRRSPAPVPPGRGELDFHFVALSFTAPDRVRVRYRLEGYDKDWVEAVNRRVASYTNLRPGSYRFRVIAANGDGIWNETGDSIPLVLQPYFYQTAWFDVLSGAGLLVALAGAYLWRVRFMRQRQLALLAARDQLEVEVAQRTRELAGANHSLHSEVLHHQRTEAELQQQTHTLEREIEERKRMETEIGRVHRQLLAASRQAGMAEVATGVLHNVGNVLNSLNVSSTLIATRARQSKTDSLARLSALLQEHTADLAGYLTTDPKGRRIPEFIDSLARNLVEERERLLLEIESLQKNIDHIKEIVSRQQAYAMVVPVVEPLDAAALMDEALHMNLFSLTRHDVKVVRDYRPAPPVLVEKGKVLQILINLIRNAKHACNERHRDGGGPKIITVRVAPGAAGCVQLTVQDNGVGIPAANLIRIFQHGFTTKATGHGFGLHSSANTAREMKGVLTARSDGPGTGASFSLELPVDPAEAMAPFADESLVSPSP